MDPMSCCGGTSACSAPGTNWAKCDGPNTKPQARYPSTVFSGILSDIYSGILSDMYFDILSDIYSGILSDIYFDILSDIYSGILSDIFWHSI